MEIIWRGNKLTPEQLETVLPVLKKHQNKPWTKKQYSGDHKAMQRQYLSYKKGQQAFASDMDRALCD